MTVDDLISELRAWRDENEDADVRIWVGEYFGTPYGGLTDTEYGPIIETIHLPLPY